MPRSAFSIGDNNSSEVRKFRLSQESSSADRAEEHRAALNCEGVWFVAERKARAKAL